MSELDLVKLAENPDPRAPCLLLLDTSASMSGKPIRALNEGLKTFHGDILKDALARRRVELAILGFGSSVELVQDFITVDGWTPPRLRSGGSTPLGEALGRGLDLLKSRKEAYKHTGLAYYRPWVFLITDGEPTDAWEEAAARARAEEEARGLVFFAVGVEGANMAKLANIAPPHRPPLKLKGLNFAELFLWLSQSQKRVSHSRVGEMLALPPVGWGEVSS
jgi:uncharacterized protein YegL